MKLISLRNDSLHLSILPTPISRALHTCSRRRETNRLRGLQDWPGRSDTKWRTKSDENRIYWHARSSIILSSKRNWKGSGKEGIGTDERYAVRICNAGNRWVAKASLVLLLVPRIVLILCPNGCIYSEMSNVTAQKLYQRSFGFIREEKLVRYYLNWGDAYRLRLWFWRKQKWTKWRRLTESYGRSMILKRGGRLDMTCLNLEISYFAVPCY